MNHIFALALLLFACDPKNSGCDGESVPDPDKQCSEFLYDTVHDPKMECLILWCGRGSDTRQVGGPATLWCHPMDAE